MTWLKSKMQDLGLELRNLSGNQLEHFKNMTESTALYDSSMNNHWKEAASVYKRCFETIDILSKTKVKGNQTLMRLSPYVFVEGAIENTEKVLVEIGGGYLVYKSLRGAKKFFKGKGASCLQLAKHYENMFYIKRLIFGALVEALDEKFKVKAERVCKQCGVHQMVTTSGNA